MASEIHEIAVQYVAEHASSYDGQSESEAVPAMTVALRRHVEDQGWDSEDFQVDPRQIAIEGLRAYRGQN